MNTYWKDQCWSCSSNTLATWWEEPTHWKRLWYWERVKTKEGGGRRIWLDSITNSMNPSLSKLGETLENRGAWCVQSMGSQRVRHDLATKQQHLLSYSSEGHMFNTARGVLKSRCLLDCISRCSEENPFSCLFQFLEASALWLMDFFLHLQLVFSMLPFLWFSLSHLFFHLKGLLWV